MKKFNFLFFITLATLLFFALSALSLSATESDQVTPVYAQGNHIKSISFNVQVDAGYKVRAYIRSGYMATAILRYDPDIIGFQEAGASWYECLKEYLGDEYDSVVKWRTSKDSEATPIFWKKDKFELLDSGYFWLSETPDEESLGWGADFHRICSWVKLRVRETGYEFYYYNTHFDFAAAPQVGSAELIIDKAKNESEGLPVIVTADFNMTWDAQGYKLLSGYFTDANTERNTQPTFNSRNDGAGSTLIDFCFYTGNSIASDNYEVIRDKFNYDGATHHISDHYGIYNDLYLLGTPKEYTVTFTNNVTGTEIPSATVIDNADFTMPEGEIVSGKRFLGWSSDGGRTLLSGDVILHADADFVAVYEDTDSYKITYMNGDKVYKSETVSVGAAHTLITNVSDLVPEAGYKFEYWTNAEGVPVTSVASVTCDLTFYGAFSEIIPLKEYYIITPENSTATDSNGLTASTVAATSSSTSYFRYTALSDCLSGDNTRAWVDVDYESMFPDQFTLHDYRFMKIGYRSNISTISIMGMNLYSVHNRVYGPAVNTTYNEEWQSVVYPLGAITSGSGADCNFVNCCDGPLKKLFIKPYCNSNVSMLSGDYFDIQYVALFKSLDEANAFNFAYDVSYDANGGTGAPVPAIVEKGDNYTVSSVKPVHSTFAFKGWSTSADGDVEYVAGDTITVSGSIRLYAVWGLDYYVIKAADFDSISGDGGLTAASGSDFARFTVDGSVSKSYDNTRGYIYFDLEKFASNFSLKDYPYMKVGYRATSIGTPKITTVGMNYITKYGRLWGAGGDNFSLTHDGTWRDAVYMLSASAGGSAFGNYKHSSGVYNFTNCGDSPMVGLFLKPYRPDNVTVLTPGDTFDVKYVAFFKTEAEANAFAYEKTGDVDSDGEVGAADVICLSRYLANWTAYGKDKVDLSVADVNFDTKVTVIDSIILSRHIANWKGYENIPVK